MKSGLSLRHVTVALSVLYAVVFILMLVIHPGSDQFYTDFHNTYQILAPLFAAVCGLAAARASQNGSTTTRLGWLLVGLGAASFTFGQSTWTFYETILRAAELPSPGLADIGYLGAYPLLILGVALLMPKMSVARRARLVIDSALAVSSVAVLSWYFVVSRMWDPDGDWLIQAISVAYPLGDISAFFCAVILLKSSSTDARLRRSMTLLASGIVLLAFADTAYTYYTLSDAYQTGSWFDWGWSFGWLLIGHAAFYLGWANPSGNVVGETKQAQTIWIPDSLRLVAPYIASMLAIAVVIISDMDPDGSIHFTALALGTGLASLVILRQILSLFENQHLTASLRTLNTDLEDMVARRTTQLNALLQLTKSINTTLNTDHVISAALDGLQQAFRADGVTLRIVEHEQQGQPPVLPLLRHLGLEKHGHVLQAIQQLPTNDCVNTMVLPAASGSGQQDLQSNYLRAPLMWQQRIIGMIGVIRWNSSFSPTEKEMLESIGVEVGTALENARQYAAAVHAADVDSVTGLFNHRAMQQRLAQIFEQASIQHTSFSIIMMDLNNFKRFNDTYGHPVGDEILRCVARVLRTESRSSDILGRYGGDEFIIILPNTDTPTAINVAKRLRDSMDREGFRLRGDQRVIPVTLSFGLATYPVDSTNRHELLAIADANLYAAKQSEGSIRSSTDNQRTNRELRTETTFEVLDAMVMAVDNKDRYTRRHSEDVTEYSLCLGEELGLPPETLNTIRIGCLLHDVGKIGVSDDILQKPGRLTAEEHENMKRHPRLGALIVGALPGMEPIVDIVRSHHERWDGRGYPDALQGEAIPFLGRLVAISDAFSAMTTDRPYRKGMGWTEALEEIRRNSGTQFDPRLATAFIAAISKHMHYLIDRSSDDHASSFVPAIRPEPVRTQNYT